jgi:hypothetical protein
VAGDADQRLRSEEPARRGGVHGVEPEVDSVGPDRERHVDPPVHDHACAAAARAPSRAAAAISSAWARSAAPDEDVRVAGHYVVRTPPPEEELPMPAVALTRTAALAAIKYDIGATSRWPKEWMVSIRRRTPYQGPTFGLFDPTVDLRKVPVDGLGPDFVFAPYRENQSEFTCELDDEWDVATLLRFVFHEP